MNIPPGHPRRSSLESRELLIKGFDRGIVAKAGLMAHGRGEAFDYLFGERTHEFAKCSIRSAVGALLLARHPVISVNGNVTSLVLDDTVRLSDATGADIEVNLFYWTKEREESILGAFRSSYPDKDVLAQGEENTISGIDSERSRSNRNGIVDADVVLTPLEDGDRALALHNQKKTVLTVDLNPFSRTARTADITIVDNIVRAFPLMVEQSQGMREMQKSELRKMMKYDNERNLMRAIDFLKGRAHFLEEII